jgi:two-component system chemotaxis response regulator CheY
MFKVLVVDDSRAVHAFIRDCFSLTPHQVTSVFNGEECLATLSQCKQDFDLILLDWEMPKLAGPETFHTIKNRNIAIPVIMMTTRNAVEDIQRMIEAGISEYMMKPFTKDILFNKIESILGRSLKNAS